MKYLVISCINRCIEIEAVCNSFAGAYEVMKMHFLEYHKNWCGYTNDELEELRHEIESDTEVWMEKYGFNMCSNDSAYAWSNVDEDWDYDIKIFQIE